MKKIARKIFVYLLIVIVFAIVYKLMQNFYPFNWKIILRYKNLFIKGLVMTFNISILSMLLAFTIGLTVALMKKSKIEILKDFAEIYVWFFRNTPLLVVILLSYYGIGTIFDISRFWSAVLGLSAFEGAYVAEIIRSGIEAVDKGEIEAAYSLGFTPFQVFESIIFPQAIRISLPPLIGQFISLFKDSSLASVIAISELTMIGRQVGTRTLASIESYLVIAFLYILLTSVLSILGRYMERRLALP